MNLTSVKIGMKTHLTLGALKNRYEVITGKRINWDEFLTILGQDALYILAYRFFLKDPKSKSFEEVLNHFRVMYFGTEELLSVYDDVLIAYLTQLLNKVKVGPEYVMSERGEV